MTATAATTTDATLENDDDHHFEAARPRARLLRGHRRLRGHPATHSKARQGRVIPSLQRDRGDDDDDFEAPFLSAPHPRKHQRAPGREGRAENEEGQVGA